MARDLKLEVLLSAVDKITGPLKKVRGNTEETGRALKEARTKATELKRALGDIDELKKLGDASQKSADQLREARDRLRDYAAQIHATDNPCKNLTESYKAARREVGKLEKVQAQQNERLRTAQQRLRDAGITAHNMADSQRALTTRLDATNHVIDKQVDRLKQLQRAEKARSDFDRRMGTAGSMAASGAGGVATGYALSRPLAAVTQAFAPAEDAATQLKAAMMSSDGTVADEFAEISRLATSLGDRLPGTTADFQEMMTMLRRQGMSAASILGGTGEAAAYLGVQLRMPVTEAAEFAAKMQDATRSTEAEMMGLMDTIQKAYYLGVDSGNMLQGFTKMSPVMNIIKQEGLQAANTLAPLLVMMDQTGMAGESAGNAIRKVFQSGLNPKRFNKANEALADLNAGFTLDFTDGNGQFGGIDNLFAQLQKLKGLSDVGRTTVMAAMFGDDSETLQTVNTLMAKGLDGYQEVAAKLKAQADLRQRVNEQLGTLTNVMEAAQGSWTNAMAEFGAAVAPELKGLITSLGEMANSVGAWARENPGLAGGLVKVLAVVAVLVTVLGGLTMVMGSILGPFAMLRYGMALFAAASTAALWPILAVIAAIAALGVAAYLIYRNWEPIKAFFIGLWNEAKAAFDLGIFGIAKLLMNWSPLGLLYRGITAALEWLGVDIPDKFKTLGGAIVDGLLGGLFGKLSALKDGIVGLAGKATTWFKDKLGIRSPSRVFAELGGYTMAGLEQGIAANQRGPLAAVAGLGKQLTAAGAVTLGMSGGALAVDSRPPLSAAGGGMQIGGDTIQITIQGGGQNSAELAQMISRMLDERERNKAARFRSALYDRD